MVKKSFVFAFFFLLVAIQFLNAQQFNVLKRSDFDLKGPVKKCVVFTKYGQEQYVFNESGFLLSAATIFSKEDSETVFYKYQQDNLIEKRVEVYTNGRLDKSSSIASFYTYDTIPTTKIKERVMNYDRVFIDQFEYKYDTIGRLSQEIRTNTEGRYQIDISYQWDTIQGIKNVSYLSDSIPVKKIDSFFKGPQRTIYKVVSTQFAEGLEKNQKVEFFNSKKQLLESQDFSFVVQDSLRVPSFKWSETFQYNPIGNPISQTIKKGVTSQSKKMLYQLDGSPYKNWIKKIITPDNTYTTRRIIYF